MWTLPFVFSICWVVRVPRLLILTSTFGLYTTGSSWRRLLLELVCRDIILLLWQLCFIAAVASLAKFGASCDDLLDSVVVLLDRCDNYSIMDCIVIHVT